MILLPLEKREKFRLQRSKCLKFYFGKDLRCFEQHLDFQGKENSLFRKLSDLQQPQSEQMSKNKK